jgi:hypothetical protein
VQQPSYDCRSACSEDEELEHYGEPTIWFVLVDDHVQHGSDAPDREHVNESQHSGRSMATITMKADEADRPLRD